ncbi:polysaccharide pyruvyl transferase family protein [Flavimarina sp. Hel_I_48]|uniref:polysaccharide pyruvyl transferase family protein n=1 Tax=Flavimarina sp. Hel_I_48 TaxID=1392488 RepID=UPI0004DF127F|nr:polysaccharide pyruvyl transferase family protein [Flavimarina sp. Hel_I_48]
MKIQIDGTNTVNKGAELMLTAVLDRLEKKFPDADIIFNPNMPGKEFDYSESFRFKERKMLNYGRYPEAILRRLKMPRSFFTAKYASKSIDAVLDAGGFHFSDQWGYPDHYVQLLEDYYRNLQKQNTKLIFLPQAFGPFKTENAQRTLATINRYAHLIIAREQVSYDYIIEAGVDPEKVKIYPDFTLSVSGKLPSSLESLKGRVCIIPNKKMITHAKGDTKSYLNLMVSLIEFIQKQGHEVFLLNHEGPGDLKICDQINSGFDTKLHVVSGLNAKEVKGVIGCAYMVISSRYHGVASALSQAVPCLSTSWNHKYEMLFKDYDLQDMILDMDSSMEVLKNKIRGLLDKQSNESMRTHLITEKKSLSESTNAMWDEVFSIIES